MSLAELCSITTCTIKRVSSTSDATMGQVRNYTTAARGSRPTSTIGRLVQGGGSRRFAYEMHDMETPTKWYTTTDPQVDESDMLIPRNSDGTDGTDLYFVQNVNEPDLLGRYWIVSLTNFSRELQ